MVGLATGMESAVTFPGYTPLVAACKGDSLKDANRQQVCSAIAEVMTERSRSMLDRTIGASIGSRAGWPADRTDFIRGEYDAYLRASLTPADESQAYGCDAVRNQIARLMRHASVGEPAAMREWAEASGRKPEDFIREEKERRAQQRRDAERAVAEQAASQAASGVR